MRKKVLLLIIDNLAKGGAEVLLVGTLPELHKRYSIILVTLTNECDFNTGDILFEKRYTLGFNTKLSFFSCIRKLKKIIKQHRPSLIHSHLFYSSLIARIACPSVIPLVYTLHGEMSKNVFNNSRLLTFLEKITIQKNHFALAVSGIVLKDYHDKIKNNNKAFVLKNYISDEYFQQKNFVKNFTDLKKIKLIAIGNQKEAKNYSYFVEAFKYLKEYNDISLDIYGRDDDKNTKGLKNEIDQNNLPIIFKGPANNLHEILPQYDLYISSSRHEGFGIAAIEAMACGLPVLLSDLPVYHEITFDNALFFDIQNTTAFKTLIKEIFENKYDLNKLSQKGIDIAKEYTKEIYLKKLFNIYDHLLNISKQD